MYARELHFWRQRQAVLRELNAAASRPAIRAGGCLQLALVPAGQVAVQGQPLELVEAVVGGQAALAEGLAECHRRLHQLESLAADLQSTLLGAEPAAFSAAEVDRTARLLGQLLEQLQREGAGQAVAASPKGQQQQPASSGLGGVSVAGGSVGASPPGAPCGAGLQDSARLALRLSPPAAPSQLRRLQALVAGCGYCGTSPLPQPDHPCSTSGVAAPWASLKAKYQEMLAGQQERHARELADLQQHHVQELKQQDETHAAALTAQREQLQNPARDAEMCLLRNENRALKDKLRALAAEFEGRQQVAAFDTRCEAEAAHQQQILGLRQQYGGLQRECAALRAQLDGVEREQAVRLEEALALQQARHDAAAAAEAQRAAAELAAAQSQFAALLDEREREHEQLLGELRALRSAAGSLAPSRAEGEESRAAAAAPVPTLNEPQWQVFSNPACAVPSERSREEALGVQGGASTWRGGGGAGGRLGLAPAQLVEPYEDD